MLVVDAQRDTRYCQNYVLQDKISSHMKLQIIINSEETSGISQVCAGNAAGDFTGAALICPFEALRESGTISDNDDVTKSV